MLKNKTVLNSTSVDAVTLLLPTRNRAVCLEQTLENYARLPCAERILINDASTEPLPLLPGGEKIWRIWVNPRRRRLPACRNIGVKQTDTPLILMGEDDVIMPPAYLEILQHRMQELDADIVAGRLIAMQRDETPEQALARSNAEAHPRYVFPDTLGGDFASVFPEPKATPFIHACALMKRKWPEQFPYDEGYKGNALREESDFYLRCHEAGAKIYFCSDAVAYHMFHDYSGGCRGNAIAYALSGIMNNHRYLDRHWHELRNLLSIKKKRWQYESRLGWAHCRMTLLFELAARAPKLYHYLKRIRSKTKNIKA